MGYLTGEGQGAAVGRGTLGRTGWEIRGLSCLCGPVVRTAGMHGALAWGGWRAGLEPVVRICGQCFGGCLLLPSHGSSQGFLQASGGGFRYAHAAS